MENDQLRVEMDGGRIQSFVDKKTGKEWVWRSSEHGRKSPTPAIGSSFDDHWTGGWEEVFPNDGPGAFNEYQLWDHGELWLNRWHVVEQTACGVQLFTPVTSMPFDVTKRVSLDREQPVLHVRYSIHNRSDSALPCFLKLHPALNVEPGDVIEMPDCAIEPVTLDFSTLLGRQGKTAWPGGYGASGDRVDINVALPADTHAREFIYASDLAEGWCAMRSISTSSRLKISFDKNDIPFVWVFQSYGGFRGHYVVMLEPATGMLWDLQTAHERRTVPRLGAGQTRTLFFQFTLEHI